jgi:hypothetical protein
MRRTIDPDGRLVIEDVPQNSSLVFSLSSRGNYVTPMQFRVQSDDAIFKLAPKPIERWYVGLDVILGYMLPYHLRVGYGAIPGRLDLGGDLSFVYIKGVDNIGDQGVIIPGVGEHHLDPGIFASFQLLPPNWYVKMKVGLEASARFELLRGFAPVDDYYAEIAAPLSFEFWLGRHLALAVGSRTFLLFSRPGGGSTKKIPGWWTMLGDFTAVDPAQSIYFRTFDSFQDLFNGYFVGLRGAF